MLEGAPVGSIGRANPSGWSNAEIFLDFLHHFVKYSHASDLNRVLLILDNHSSHISVQSLNYAKENGVIMLTMPPHTSHKLQPLDRTVFGPFKKYYYTACSEWLYSNSGKIMSIYDVAECAGKAFSKGFSSENIQSGFRVSGIFPLNRNIFAEHEFLSSFVTDRPADLLNETKSSIVASSAHRSADLSNETRSSILASSTDSSGPTGKLFFEESFNFHS